MAKIFLMFLLTNKILETNCKDIQVFSDEDVLLTNYSTTRNDIADDCYLFGSEFLSSDPLDNIYMNATHQGSFWVHATISFKRNINPIGVLFDCKENRPSNFSLDECSSQCSHYFNHGTKSCHCTFQKNISESLVKIDSCDNEEMGLCSTGKCVLYQKIIRKQDYICGTYQYYIDLGSWFFKTEKCTKKENGFICHEGNVPIYDKNATFTWYEAYQKCKDDGYDLLHNSKVDFNKFKDGRTYWVSFLRRQKILWGKDYNADLCVAANIEANGSLTLTSKLCSEKLHSLCYRNISSKGRNSGLSTDGGSMTGVIFGGCIGALMLIVILVIGIKKCTRTRKLKYMEAIIKKNSLVEQKETYESKEVPLPPSSVYSLSGTYSDPINSVSINKKEQVSSEYAEVNYNTKSTNTNSPERQLIENPYQIPEA